MNIFDIIGPVMIGPSSSHTAGAVRLGRVANKLMEDLEPEELEITLSGSFACTYQGHGTDRALLAGIMGYDTDSEEIRNALEIAQKRGIRYTFLKEDLPDSHPNTARICYRLRDGRVGMIQGASIGGGNICVELVDGMRVDFSGENHTILILHRDRPGIIASVTSLIRDRYLNICCFHLTREEKGGRAIMTIELDSISEEVEKDLRKLDDVINAIVIRAI